MIEVVYRQENVDRTRQDTGFKLPKNIKQIGGGDSDIQVYMEDDVALYLSKVPDNEENIRYGVLLGNVKSSCGYTYVFIKGAVDVRDVFDNTVLFGDDIWTALNDDISEYFQGMKVVGWFLSQRCVNSNQNMWIKKMHLNNFAGMDKVFFKIERDEEEENFYYYGNDRMEKLPCYHIYYEKNPQMKEYMTETNADIARAAQKKAEEIKKEIYEKNEEPEKTENVRKLNNIMGKAASFLIMGSLVAAIGVMGQSGKLDNLFGEVKSLVAGIMNDDDSMSGGDGIISVNGVPKPSESTTMEPVSKEDETTTAVDDSAANETPSNDDSVPTQGSAEEQTTIPEQNVSVEPVSTSSYKVQKGETLYGICKKLYGSLENLKIIMELNDIEDPNEIYYGEILIVP